MRRQQLALLVVLLIGGSLLVLATHSSSGPVRPLGLSSHRLSFGSSGLGNTGWLVPANTLISTSYTSDQRLSGFVVATLNAFPYQIRAGTVLYLGLYIAGQLAATEKYVLNGNYKSPASIVGTSQNGIASFSNSTLGFTVSQFPLSKPYPRGTMVTVTVWVNNPIWVQIDATSPAHSYEMSGVVSYSAPTSAAAEAGIIGPYTLSVGFESSEE